tara:strand:+ start:800 stop:1132 length:333 start_codon:yes stop_codon:yes gene_type:complete
MNNTNQLRIYIIALTTLIIANGCAFLPIPWQVTAANTAGDLVTLQNHGKTMNETAASIVLEKDCQWSRILIGWKPCLTKKELVDNLYKMNCKTYAWNFINIPYCSETKEI